MTYFESSRERWYFFKKVAIFLIPSILILYSILLILGQITREREQQYLLKRDRASITSLKEEILTHMHGIVADLFLMKDSFSLYDPKIFAANNRHEFLTNKFFLILKNKRIYDQARFIDTRGNEIIRINFNNGNPEIVPTDKLQPKAHRYYFSNAIGLSENQVYVSEFDLNIENKEIEQPIKPMIRFATPVFDMNGKKIGVVVLNYLGDFLIKHIKTYLGKTKDKLLILNGAGYYMVSDQPEKNWAFMYPDKQNINFKTDFPAVWEQLKSKQAETLEYADGHFIIDVVDPLQVNYFIKDPANMLDIRTGNPGQIWYLIANLTDREIETSLAPELSQIRNGFYVVFIVLFLSAIVFAQVNLHRKRAESALLSHQMNLEKQIAYRTADLKEVNSKLQEEIAVRIEAESALFRLNQLVEQSTASVFITDLDGTIIYTNEAASRISGYAREELIGKNPSIFKSGETPPQVYQELWQTLKKGETWYGNFKNRHKSGTFFWEEAVISPLRNSAGEITNYTSIKLDITEKYNLEQRLSQKSKMEAIGRLAGGVAHDFNNILTVIMGYSDILRASSDISGENQAYLDDLVDSSERAARLTRQLLALGKKQVFETRVFDLNELIRNLEKMLSRLIRENIVLEFDLKAKPATVHADEAQIEQIILNLIVNARDSIDAAGTIRIESTITTPETASEIQDNFDVGTKLICLAVHDTGHGMTDEIRLQIFEPFFSTKKTGEGYGLGLATVYGIIEQSGGSITVESAPGRGSTFRVYLPLFDQMVTADQADEEEAVSATGTGQRILVVEDQKEVCDLLVRSLNFWGYSASGVGSAEEAIRNLNSNNGPKFDLLITDVVMPGMGGIELSDAIAKSNHSITTLFISGYPSSDLPEIVALKPESHYMQKPFSTRQLAHKVHEILKNHS
jgi:PAS domain S-box-containing protein